MRGGGIGATLEAFPTPLGSTIAPLAAPITAAFGRAPPKCPVAAEPAPRANEGADVAKTMNNAIASFTDLFDMGNLH
jgi:hypothetical protein